MECKNNFIGLALSIDKPEAKSQSKVQVKSKKRENGIWEPDCH